MLTRLGSRGNCVTAKFTENNEEWKAVVKPLHYRWNSELKLWERRLDSLSGRAIDRITETALALLTAGFPVELPDSNAYIHTKAGQYIPEQKRWVITGRGEFEGWFRLLWRYEQENFYKRAMFITGAQYDHVTKCVCVPPEMFNEVRDFSVMHSFEFDAKATVLLQEREQLHSSSCVITNMDMPTEQPRWQRPVLYPGGVQVPHEHIDAPYLPRFDTTTELYPHQIPAIEKLKHMRYGGLFMDMGLGKTRCAIEFAAIRQQRISKVVWFCPVSLKYTARHEIMKHTTCTDADIYIFEDKTTTEILPDATWYIIGLESLSNSDRVTLAANNLVDNNTMVVVDESSYIKGYTAKRTQRIIQMCQHCAYRLIMTGTPLTEGYEDLYTQMTFLSPLILGYNSFYSFAANHLEYHPDYPGLVVKAHNTQYLASKLAPYVYQVTKDEALKLPDKVYKTRYCGLSDEQWKYYHNAKRELLDYNSDALNDSYALFQLFSALQQIVSGFITIDNEIIDIPHYRLDILLHTIENIAPEEPVIIWCKYVHSLKVIKTALESANLGGVSLYYGELTEQERAKKLAVWNKGEARFLLATAATGGHGLDLTHARYSIFYENEFNYSHRIQTEDRTHRIGQESRPVYISIYAECGIERHIEHAIARKENVTKAFKREVRKNSETMEEL